MAGGGSIIGGGKGRPNAADVTNGELHVRLSAIGGVTDVNIVSPLPLPVTIDDSTPIRVDLSGQSSSPIEVSIVDSVDPIEVMIQEPAFITVSQPLPISLDAQTIPLELNVSEARFKISESADGEPVAVKVTPAVTEVHKVPNDRVDQVYLWATNVSDVDDDVLLDLGDGFFTVKVRSPSNETVNILDGMPIGGNVATGPTVRAQRLLAGSDINVFGYIITTPQ